MQSRLANRFIPKNRVWETIFRREGTISGQDHANLISEAAVCQWWIMASRVLQLDANRLDSELLSVLHDEFNKVLGSSPAYIRRVLTVRPPERIVDLEGLRVVTSCVVQLMLIVSCRRKSSLLYL